MRGEIKQICILVDDIYKAMKNYWDLLQIGPWNVRHFNPKNCNCFEVGGRQLEEGFYFITAVAVVGDIEFELVQPIKGPNVYWEILKSKGSCIHHFKVVIKDILEMKEYLKVLEKNGIYVTQTGQMDGELHAYLATEDKLGFIIELGNAENDNSKTEMYPPEAIDAPKLKRELNIKQIGILVDNKDFYLKNLSELFDIKPWNIYSFDPEHVSYFEVDGKKVTQDYKFITCCCNLGNIELELMQPISGDNIYWKDLNTTGVGLHHIKDVMSNAELEETIKYYRERGIRVIQSGHLEEDWHYYMDTKEQLGFLLELGNGGAINNPIDTYPRKERQEYETATSIG